MISFVFLGIYFFSGSLYKKHKLIFTIKRYLISYALAYVVQESVVLGHKYIAIRLLNPVVKLQVPVFE